MKRSVFSIAMSFGLLLPSAALADELGDASLAFCQRMRACTYLQYGGEDKLSHEAREGILYMTNNLCMNLEADMRGSVTSAKEEREVTACMQSLAGQSCGAFMNGTHFNTPECQVLMPEQPAEAPANEGAEQPAAQ